MAAELPPQLQDQLAQLQTVQQQLQLAAQQRAQLEFQLREAERALEELGKLEKDAPVYRSIGSLLIRTPGRDAVQKQLTEDKESLEVRLRGFEKQEGRLKEKATELQSRVQAALKNLNSGRSSGAAKGGKTSA